jgi:phosphotransferase system HPr (HPr) family protein
MHLRDIPGITRVQRLFRVSDPDGLHMRPAALLAQAAGQLDAEVLVQHGETVACGKSLLDLLTLCAGAGELLSIVTEGADANDSMNRLEDTFETHRFLVKA